MRTARARHNVWESEKKNPECCQNLPPHYSGNADISFSPYFFFKWDNDSPTRFCLFFCCQIFCEQICDTRHMSRRIPEQAINRLLCNFFAAGKFGEITIMHHCPWKTKANERDAPFLSPVETCNYLNQTIFFHCHAHTFLSRNLSQNA